jgi:cytochrome c oxidase subunit 2
MTAWLDTIQSAAGNDGQQSALVSQLFAIFLAVTTLFFLAVMAFLLWAIVRRRRDGESRERGLRKLLVGWVGLISLTLAGLTLATWLFDRALAEAAAAPALEIEVTANQWWWDVRYADDDASLIFRTANELHLPAGVPAHITLRSNDVIHSFWIPNLAGKQDMIPGREADISIRPLREGAFRAQCAEFAVCSTRRWRST